jgi:Tfp pilus assembly PilM family ATPase
VPRYLAIDWDQNQLHVVVANVGGGKVQIQRAAVWQEEKSPNPADAELLGKVLRERLKQAGISPAPVLACVGRDRVILKDIRHPEVPQAEEAGLVRFQAVKELTDSPDDVVLDYVPMGRAEGSIDQRALVLIVRKELVQTYQTLCQAAGLKLAGMTPRPFGMASTARKVMGSTALTPAPEPPDAAVAVVTLGDRWAEFCVVRNGQLLLARSLVLGPALAGNVRTSLTVYSGQAPQQPVKAIYLTGAVSDLRQRLTDMLPDMPIHSFDPFSGAEAIDLPPAQRGAFAGAVGLLYARAEPGGLPINFMQPREPKKVADPGRKRVLVWGLIAAMALLVIFVMGRSLQASREAELEEVQTDKSGIEADLAKAKDEVKRLKLLADWDSLPWLDEVYDLAHRIPDLNALRITSINAEPLPRGKGRFVGRLTLRGTIRNGDRGPVDELIKQFSHDGYYSPEAPQINRGQFTVIVNIERRPPSEYKRVLKSAL